VIGFQIIYVVKPMILKFIVRKKVEVLWKEVTG